MSEKMTCPGCGAHLSRVLMAFERDEPCPECGLSSAAASEVLAVQERRADEELKRRLETAIVERDKAQAETRKLRAKLDEITRTVARDPDDFTSPW